jgi:hypothetical protein
MKTIESYKGYGNNYEGFIEYGLALEDMTPIEFYYMVDKSEPLYLLSSFSRSGINSGTI